MRNLILSTFTFFGLVLSLTCSSHAGVILVDTRHSVSTGEPTIDNTGTLIAAFNFGNADITTQGISFVGTNNSIGPFTVGAQTYTFGGNGLTVANSYGSNTLFHSAVYTQGNGAMTLTISGLVASKSYRVQFLHGDSRNLAYAASMTYTDSSNNTITPTLNFGTNDSFANVNQIIEVSGSTSLFASMPRVSTRGPGFEGLVVSEVNSQVPEPTSLAIFAFGITCSSIVAKCRKKNVS